MTDKMTVDEALAADELIADMRAALVHSEGSGEPIKADDVGEWLAIAATLRDELARVRGERDALRADAERYRWLRSADNALHDAWDSLVQLGCTDDAFDAAIDAARAESGRE